MAGAAQHFENSHADSLAGSALCEHPCRFRGRRSTLCTSMCRCRGRSNKNSLLCGEIANVRNAVFSIEPVVPKLASQGKRTGDFLALATFSLSMEMGS